MSREVKGGNTVDLMSLTAVELGKRIRAGEVSVREAAEAALAAEAFERCAEFF